MYKKWPEIGPDWPPKRHNLVPNIICILLIYLHTSLWGNSYRLYRREREREGGGAGERMGMQFRDRVLTITKNTGRIWYAREKTCYIIWSSCS